MAGSFNLFITTDFDITTLYTVYDELQDIFKLLWGATNSCCSISQQLFVYFSEATKNVYIPYWGNTKHSHLGNTTN